MLNILNIVFSNFKTTKFVLAKPYIRFKNKIYFPCTFHYYTIINYYYSLKTTNNSDICTDGLREFKRHFSWNNTIYSFEPY